MDAIVEAVPFVMQWPGNVGEVVFGYIGHGCLLESVLLELFSRDYSTVVRSCSSHDPSLGASTQAATGHDAPVPIWCQSQENSLNKHTPLFVGSAITRWYKATSPLEKECSTFLPAASGR
jgi:hypothetical protein